jgi:TRAP-type C4-dicarboxylate transport system substrate-binding protein
MRSASVAIGVATTCVAALLGGCATGPASKAGVEATVLRFASIDSVNANGQSYGPQAFMDQLAAVSGGRLKVRLATKYEDGAPRAEVDLLKEITAGRLDGGWPATRAFAAAGIGHLAAVEAPMTITSYAGQKALVTSPVAADLMKTLEGSGAVGLGLTVGPLRRPFASKAPLLAPTDWKGVRFRAFSSPVQAEAVRALGGVPVDLSFAWSDEVKAGHLRGGEFDVAQYVQNGLTTEAGEVTGNVVLWPKMYVLAVSQRRFDSLTRQQQGWVREAAARAVHASATADYDETMLSQKMCSAGAHFTTADPDTLARLHAALEPVIARLASSSADRNFLRRIQALAAGPADVLTPLAGCKAPADLTGVGSIPDTVAELPPGSTGSRSPPQTSSAPAWWTTVASTARGPSRSGTTTTSWPADRRSTQGSTAAGHHPPTARSRRATSAVEVTTSTSSTTRGCWPGSPGARSRRHRPSPGTARPWSTSACSGT